MTDVKVKVVKRSVTVGPPTETRAIKVLAGPRGLPGVTLVGEGARIFEGSGDPVDPIGSPPAGNGEWYINSDDASMWQRQAGIWIEILNLTGPQGPVGPPGADGAVIIGGNTTPIHFGDGPPAPSLGEEGDIYIDNLTDDVYLHTGSTGWILQTNIRGSQGAQGLQGPQGTPGTNGTNGWSPILAVVTDGSRRVLQVTDWTGGTGTKPTTGDYISATGLTSVLANAVDIRGAQGIQGVQGDPGTNGADGADGAPGSVWRFGSGVPSNSLGIDGDFYLDTNTGNVYTKASGVYSFIDNIDGTMWHTGSGVPSNGLGLNGDLYLDTANGDVYLKSSGSYSVISNIMGPAGADGADGAAGAVWRSGSGVPSNGTGIDGDFYLRTSNGDVYERQSGTYTVVANILGPQGPQGDPGADGSTGASVIEVIIGDGVNVISTGLAGYYYLPFAGTINSVVVLSEQSGSIVVEIQKCTYTQFDAGATHPVTGDKINSSTPPTLSSATKSKDSTLTSWTTSFSADDVLAFVVNSVTSCKRVTLAINVTKS